MSAFCSSEKRLPYWAKMVWMRASTSAWLSGESFGRAAGCCGSTALLGGVERRPPRSAAATGAGSFDGAAGVVSAAAGATEAIAEASAARRANSRREMPATLDVVGLEVSSIKFSVCILRRSKERPAAGRGEAIESRVERQQRGKESGGKEASRQMQWNEGRIRDRICILCKTHENCDSGVRLGSVPAGLGQGEHGISSGGVTHEARRTWAQVMCFVLV